MKTINDWENMWDADSTSARVYRSKLVDCKGRLEKLYDALSEIGPRETAAAWVAVDPDSVRTVMATLVNQMQHDGRISRAVKTWAAMQDCSWDYESANMLDISYTNIHAAHLGQIFSYAVKALG